MNEGMLRKESDDEESEDRNIDRRSSILYTEVCHLQHSPKPLKDPIADLPSTVHNLVPASCHTKREKIGF
jgi:hypothetical protein